MSSIRRFCLLLFCLIPIMTFAQSPKWLNVDSLEIDIAHQSMEIVEIDSNGKWIVSEPVDMVVFWLREDQVKVINNWSSRRWLRKLKDPKTSYVTNWLLYSLSERNIYRRTLPKEAIWRNLYYLEEIAFWRAYLKNHSLPMAQAAFF